MIVLDASALVELLMDRSGAEAVRRFIELPGQSLHVPHLVDIEVASVLRRESLAGRLRDERATEALSDLSDLPLLRYPHQPMLTRIWELRHSVTAYDAVYLALAEGLNAPLLTLDSRLTRAHGHRARIEWIPPAGGGGPRSDLPHPS